MGAINWTNADKLFAQVLPWLRAEVPAPTAQTRAGRTDFVCRQVIVEKRISIYDIQKMAVLPFLQL